MKKYVSLALVFCMLLSFMSGCKKDNEDTNSSITSSKTSSIASSQTNSITKSESSDALNSSTIANNDSSETPTNNIPKTMNRIIDAPMEEDNANNIEEVVPPAIEEENQPSVEDREDPHEVEQQGDYIIFEAYTLAKNNFNNFIKDPTLETIRRGGNGGYPFMQGYSQSWNYEGDKVFYADKKLTDFLADQEAVRDYLDQKGIYENVSSFNALILLFADNVIWVQTDNGNNYFLEIIDNENNFIFLTFDQFVEKYGSKNH